MSLTPIVHWHQLAVLRPEELAKVDVAFVNLLCALGLPGAEKLDVSFCLRQIDLLAERVGRDTDRAMYSYHRDPANYENSEAYFRILMMITVLQRDYGIRYML